MLSIAKEKLGIDPLYKVQMPSLPKDINKTPCPHCAGDDTQKAKPQLKHWTFFGQLVPFFLQRIIHIIQQPSIENENYGEWYCSERCRNLAWNSYHQLLCPGLLDGIKRDSLMILLSFYREAKQVDFIVLLKVLAMIEIRYQKEG